MISEEFNKFWRLEFGEDYIPSNVDGGVSLQQTVARHQPDLLDGWTVKRMGEIERNTRSSLADCFDTLASGYNPRRRSFALPFFGYTLTLQSNA